MNEMINRRSFLGFLPATLGLAAVPALIKVNKVPAMALPGESVIQVKLLPGFSYLYDNSQVVLQVSADVRLGEPLYQGNSGKITNNASGDGYSSFIGTAISHSDPDKYCKVQLARLI